MIFESEIFIKNTKISIDSPTYFIADIAANHDGDLQRAKDLICLAKESGANAVKFQHFTAEKIVSDFGFKKLGNQIAHQGSDFPISQIEGRRVIKMFQNFSFFIFSAIKMKYTIFAVALISLKEIFFLYFFRHYIQKSFNLFLIHRKLRSLIIFKRICNYFIDINC